MTNISYENIVISNDNIVFADVHGFSHPLYTFVHMKGDCSYCKNETNDTYTSIYPSRYTRVPALFRTCANKKCTNFAKFCSLLTAYSEGIFVDHNFKNRDVIIKRSDGTLRKVSTLNKPIIITKNYEVILDVVWLEKGLFINKSVSVDSLRILNKNLPLLEMNIPKLLVDYLEKDVMYLKNIQNIINFLKEKVIIKLSL